MIANVRFLCGFILSALAVGAAVAQDSRIQPGELVHIDVHRRPELSSSVRVDDSGMLMLPYVGPVAVTGLTEEKATQRVEEAFARILRRPDVTVTRGGQGRVSSARGTAMVTETIALQNASAENLMASLQGITSSGGSINYDGDTNTIIITDRPDVISQIRGAVTDLDAMTSQLTQVSIETKIAEAQEGALKELGVRWFVQGTEPLVGFNAPENLDPEIRNFRGQDNNEAITSRGVNSTSPDRRFVNGIENVDRRLNVPVMVPTDGQFFFGFLNEHIDLGLLLDMLVTDKDAELLAHPMIVTSNHKTANIKMTEEFPFTETLTGFGFAQATTRFLDVGIVLDVTPHVLSDANGPYVKMELRPEVSSLSGTGANGVPIRSVRSSESVVSVRDGQTLVIGGVFQDSERNTDQGVPFLRKIPVLKWLFKKKEKNQQRTELIIFVTPRIHEKPEDLTWQRMVDISPAWPAETMARSGKPDQGGEPAAPQKDMGDDSGRSDS